MVVYSRLCVFLNRIRVVTINLLMNNRSSRKMTVQAALQLTGSQVIGSLTHLAFGMNPAGFHRIEPGVFGRQTKDQQADTSLAVSPLVVGSNPLTDDSALVPTAIIQDQHDDALGFPTGNVQKSGEEDQGLVAVRLPICKIQADLIGVMSHRPKASQGFLLVPLSLALNPQEFRTRLRPSMDCGLGKARKPTFILLEQQSVCVSGGLLLQPVTPLFLPHTGRRGW